MKNAVIIESDDDVVVAVEPIAAGEDVVFLAAGGERESFKAVDPIPIYHKAARRFIDKGGKIKKYGEHIGEALCAIAPGMHVHTHNLAGVRENLDH